MDELKSAISQAHDTFPNLAGLSGDPNTIDVLWVSKTIQDSLDDPLSISEISAENSVEIVELVESNFIDGLIRNLPKERLKVKAENLANAITTNSLLGELSPEQKVAIALSLWHGCICMAKSCRAQTGQGQTYTTALRQRGYNNLKTQWEQEENSGNPWVKRGVAVANLFETNRGNTLIDDWVPQNSPYR
jgi:hypothetical protein